MPPQSIAKELELKLLASPDDRKRLRDSIVVARHADGSGEDKHLHSVYYDTVEHSLAEKRFSLRVREDGSGLIQTLKFAPPEEKAFSRHEWETPVQERLPDLSRFPASAIGPVLSQLRGKALVPVFSTSVQRHSVNLSIKETKLELAFDEGVISAGDREEPLTEIEIELKKGETARLYELALQLLAIAPLRWSTESKFDRGYALARGVPPPTSKPPPSSLVQDTKVDDAIAAILAGCQRHLLANQPAAEDGRDPEGVHQMRVALRRMRAAFALLRHELASEGLDSFDREAKWVAHKLGACRNWDVFETETLAKAKIGKEQTILKSAATAHRDASYAEMRKAFAEQRYNRFQLSLGHWIEAQGWRDDADAPSRKKLSGPVGKFAPSPLDALLRNARKKGKRFDELSLRKRHRLRVGFKKLRYAIEFFQPLYCKQRATSYSKQLAKLQKLLGKDSDAITTSALLDELTENGPASLRHAASVLRKWQTAERRRAAPKARKAWLKLRKTRPFW